MEITKMLQYFSLLDFRRNIENLGITSFFMKKKIKNRSYRDDDK